MLKVHMKFNNDKKFAKLFADYKHYTAIYMSMEAESVMSCAAMADAYPHFFQDCDVTGFSYAKFNLNIFIGDARLAGRAFEFVGTSRDWAVYANAGLYTVKRR